MNNTLYSQMMTLLSVILCLSLTVVCEVDTAVAQSNRGRSSARDIAREIQRVDREQLLLRSPITSPKTEAARMTLLKKTREDFRALQAVNNKMMAEVWASEQIDYGHTAEMISQIRDKAIALKTNLSLPSDSNAKKPQPPNTINNQKDLREALLVLDRSIMSFVNNPLFQKPDVVEVNQAMQASRDLEAVISLSGDLRKMTARLNNAPKRTQ
jgi:hypothetical protein